ncbi:MAG: nucleotide-binding protein [Thermodesulfobacteriota bacterium]|nr:nucleotide-binding protein [Thermodesulfobacteriota bacterium]
MTVAEELFKIADRLVTQSKQLQEEEFNKPLQALTDASEQVGKAWSGSWLGYHSRVYYADLAEPPPGARFSQEWGMMDTFTIQDTVGDWREYRFDDVVSAIQKYCGNPETNEQEVRASTAREVFEESQSQVLSLLSTILETRQDDKFLHDIPGKVEKMKVFGAGDFIKVMRPSGQMISRDMPAIQAGLHTPPHISVLSQIHAIRYPFTACEELSKLTRRAASHIQNIEKHKVQSERIGTNVFIGHGRSSVWKDLKDFIQDRMRLPWDEFNRVPVAGFTNIARLSQMLDDAAIAFLIMTAEDEQADGKQYARQNVIHEAGLFQGRLGFERAIILLEEGCEEFSNVQGLGQIRFPNGNVSAIFEDIRRVLEREGLVDE